MTGGRFRGPRRSFEAEVELEAVEPGDVGIDTLGLEFFWEIGVMAFERPCIGSVVIGDQDRVIVDAHVSFQSAEKTTAEVGCIPATIGKADALAELMDDRLRH